MNTHTATNACPSCGGVECKSKRAVHLLGTESGDAVTLGVGAGFGGIGGIGTRKRSNSATGAAKACAPPAMPKDHPFIALFAVIGLWAWLAPDLGEAQNAAAYILLTLATLAALAINQRISRRRHVAASAAWSREWFCMTCAHAWAPHP